MFILSIIIGSLLYSNCYVTKASRNSTYNGPSQNINDNHRPNQTQTSTPRQNHYDPVTTPENIYYSEALFIDRFPHQTTNRSYGSRNVDYKIHFPPNSSMRATPEIGGKPVPPFSENPEKIVGNRDSSVALSSNHNNWGLSDDNDKPDPTKMREPERFLWQVSVFSKEVSPRVRVCGGSLVTSSAVISAAQCFWGVGPLPADQFAVAAGEVDDDIDNYDDYQHWGDVRDIRLSPRFRGAASSFQDDLAVVVLALPLPPALRPVCVSFDWELEQQQLMESVGWVLGVEKEVHFGSVVRRHRVPHLSLEDCFRLATGDQLRFITSDKFCAGFRGARDPPICNYDIGSGLVYFQDSSSIPFLRGVVSLPLGDSCVTAFTHVATHRAFLLRHVSGLEAECARRYPGARGAVKEEGGGNLFVCNCYC